MRAVSRTRKVPAAARADGEPQDFIVVGIPTRALTFDGFNEWVFAGKVPPGLRVSFLGTYIVVQLPPDQVIQVPVTADTLEGFCDWVLTKDFPTRGRVSFLEKEIVIDMSPEEILTHSPVKAAVSNGIYNLNEELDLGRFYPDGVWLTNPAADLSTEPDGTFVSWESRTSGRVRLVSRRKRGFHYTQMIGTPDWVLEVVSQTSVRDDTVVLRRKYYQAGIPEYWLIDARGAEVVFQVLVRRQRGYAAVRPAHGWHKSRVFGRGFRLVRRRDRLGEWQYKLEVKPA